jgi:hypothetical protein
MHKYTMEKRERKFWERVTKTNDCWVFTGKTNRHGYGRIWHTDLGKEVAAHRYAWELFNGHLAAELDVLHTCDNPPCVRPDHLFTGTQADNNRDKIAKGRQPMGTRFPWARLTEEQIPVIRAMRTKGLLAKQIAEHFGVHEETIGYILRGKTWRHVK